MASIKVNSNGIGLGMILFIVFLVLKLCKVINWSWWLVTAPLWGPIALGLAVVVVVFVIGLIIIGIAALCGK